MTVPKTLSALWILALFLLAATCLAGPPSPGPGPASGCITRYIELKNTSTQDLLQNLRLTYPVVIGGPSQPNILILRGKTAEIDECETEIRRLDSNTEAQEVLVSLYVIARYEDQAKAGWGLPMPAALEAAILLFAKAGEKVSAPTDTLGRYRLLQTELFLFREGQSQRADMLLPDFLRPDRPMAFTLGIRKISRNLEAGSPFVQLENVRLAAWALGSDGKPEHTYCDLDSISGGMSARSAENIPTALGNVGPANTTYKLWVFCGARLVDGGEAWGTARVKKGILSFELGLDDPFLLKCQDVPLEDVLDLLGTTLGTTCRMEGGASLLKTKVTLAGENATIRILLNQMAARLHFRWAVLDKAIVLKPE